MSMYEDKTLICKECGREFVWTAGEQEFYAEKGFTNEPKRCPECRKKRRTARSRSGSCTTPSAQPAASRARFPFSPPKAGPSIAANAMQN